jgi:Rhodanese-related sulfurtransferase
MTLPETSGLCETAWLAEHLDDPHVHILDGSFFLPGSGRSQRDEFAACHIPGAQIFDVDAICDPNSHLPHMLPSPDVFAAKVQQLGISNANLVVAYDAPGSAAAARVWWTFRVFGHDAVVILDGGLAKWKAEGRPTASGDPQPPVAGRFVPGFRPQLVRTAADLLRNAQTRDAQVVDARSPGRYQGVEPEPRPSRRQGHIPGSANIPFSECFDPSRHGSWRSNDELALMFATARVDLVRPIVCYCGSGVTACVPAFAAFRLGYEDAAVYDGSWAEWGNRDDTPIDR